MSVSSRKHLSGRKRKDYTKELAAFRNIPVSRRGTLRSASSASGIQKTTLIEQIKDGYIRVHSNVVKPVFTETNEARHV